MGLFKLAFKPGFYRDGTYYTEPGRWFDGNMVRFRGNHPERIGGWTRYSANTFLGYVRRLIKYSILNGEQYLGVGTTQKFYAENSGTFNDVTPLDTDRTATNLSNPLRTMKGQSQPSGAPTITDATIEVTDAGHGAAVGDWITVAEATDLDGIVAADLNIEAQVTYVTSSSVYWYESNGTATSGNVTGGGTGVDITYQISLTEGSTPAGTGFGAGPFDSTVITRHWGDPIDLSAIPGGGQATMWSADTYGEDLIFAPRYGRIYYWDASAPTTRAVRLDTLGGSATPPVRVTWAGVSQKSRHGVALGVDGTTAAGGTDTSGAIDAMLVRWSDNNDIADWTPTTTNTAGAQRLTRGSKIITGIQTRDLILVFTDIAVYAMQWIGGQYIFSFSYLAETNIAGFMAGVAVGDAVFWMGRESFYYFDGTVHDLPCTVKDYIYDDETSGVDWTESDLITTHHNSEFNEVWWFYVSNSSSNGQPDKYVVYNYESQSWYYGSMARTFMINDQFSRQIIGAGTDNYLYYHEDGFDDYSSGSAAGISAHIESTPFEIGEGDKFMFATRLIHDLTWRGRSANPSVAQKATVTIKASDYPGQDIQTNDTATPTKSAVTPVEQFTTYSDIRLRGRQFKYRLESSTLGSSWRLGYPRIEIREDGRK